MVESDFSHQIPVALVARRQRRRKNWIDFVRRQTNIERRDVNFVYARIYDVNELFSNSSLSVSLFLLLSFFSSQL